MHPRSIQTDSFSHCVTSRSAADLGGPGKNHAFCRGRLARPAQGA
jgi:hypothetical protein